MGSPIEARVAETLLVIAGGEQLAERAARRQCDLARDAGERAFFAQQARQEAFHGLVFSTGARWFGGGGIDPAVTRAYRRYGDRLDDAFNRRDLLDSVIGMQVVFEALGSAVLEAFERRPSGPARGFRALRARVAREEAMHHAFGARMLGRLLARADAPAHDIDGKLGEYRALAIECLRPCASLFDALGADAEDCRNGFEARLAGFVKACGST